MYTPTNQPTLPPPPTPVPVTVPKRTRHGFHMLMTVFTFGLWVPVWIICAILNAGKTETTWVAR